MRNQAPHEKMKRSTQNGSLATKLAISLKKRFGLVLSVTLLGSLLSLGSAHAAEEGLFDTSDTRPSLMWLSNDVNVSVFDSESQYNSFLGKSEVWTDNWGVSAKLLQNNEDDVFGMPEDSEFFNLDVKRRFGAQDKSNFELGLGWQELTIDSQLEASGPRVSVAGRLNLFDSFQVYGLTSYFPELVNELNKESDVTAYEIEAGLLYQPLPSMSLKAGYRVFNLDLEDEKIQDLGSSTGFLLGTDLSW